MRKIVDRRYFLNGKVLSIWAVFILYLAVSLVFDYIWLKGIFFAVVMLMVYRGCESFFGVSEKIVLLLKRKRGR